MRILAIERDLKPIPDESRNEILKREAEAVWRLQQADVVREICLAEGGTKAVLLLECADVAQARSRLASLPLVEGGYIAFEFFDLRPYPGYSRLFEAS